MDEKVLKFIESTTKRLDYSDIALTSLVVTQ